jgi:hypothetical protein
VIGVEAVVRSAGRKVKRATKGGARSKEWRGVHSILQYTNHDILLFLLLLLPSMWSFCTYNYPMLLLF